MKRPLRVAAALSALALTAFLALGGAACDPMLAKFAGCQTDADCPVPDGGKLVCYNLRCVECHYDADCVDGALDRSSADADTVLAVADAEHAADQPGGWGRPGTWPTCDGTCPASTTLRAAYVGASDFHPDWGPVPLLDLIEHELGHTLGLPHSGSPASGGDQYLSALDVMSNSAAPRDVDPARRDAPDTIAVDRLEP